MDTPKWIENVTSDTDEMNGPEVYKVCDFCGVDVMPISTGICLNCGFDEENPVKRGPYTF